MPLCIALNFLVGDTHPLYTNGSGQDTACSSIFATFTTMVPVSNKVCASIKREKMCQVAAASGLLSLTTLMSRRDEVRPCSWDCIPGQLHLVF